uniref:Uncharacterized protein n=1 Tax=Anguilla anguilla TaxID=7936 RepID=A0A0E9UQS3_ANGAN
MGTDQHNCKMYPIANFSMASV